MNDRFQSERCRRRVNSLPSYLVPVLASLSEGNGYKQIAAELHLSEMTVRTYIERIYSRLGVQSAVQATRVAVAAEVV